MQALCRNTYPLPLGLKVCYCGLAMTCITYGECLRTGRLMTDLSVDVSVAVLGYKYGKHS